MAMGACVEGQGKPRKPIHAQEEEENAEHIMCWSWECSISHSANPTAHASSAGSALRTKLMHKPFHTVPAALVVVSTVRG
mmetsp:Transcript_20821/g.35590  ORF Transcript_20821/g.35590 Transcript_20821/m.35590 type:complete len:80 (-) Transcript_20821:2306-2545(-)